MGVHRGTAAEIAREVAFKHAALLATVRRTLEIQAERLSLRSDTDHPDDQLAVAERIAAQIEMER